jgi:hypothetical protein
MYQWVNPVSGRTQFSGKPPPWYRSDVGGPRVFVFEGGRLLDDTAIHVPEGERQALRNQAIQAANLTGQAPIEKTLKPPETRSSDASEGKGQSPEKLDAEQGADAKSARTGEGIDFPKELLEGNQESDSEAIERLKSVISDWDKRRTEEAKRFIEGEAQPAAEPATQP